MFEFFKRKNKEPEYHIRENTELKELKKDVDEKIKSVREENEQLRRIIQNYIPGKITYALSHVFNGIFCYPTHSSFVRLYCDGKEYSIEKLTQLYDPTFKKNDNGTVVIFDFEEIKNDESEVIGKKEYEYVVNLEDCTFIQTK